MSSDIRPLAFDPTGLKGLSQRLIVSRHENNYGGAVKRLDAIRARIDGIDFAAAPGFLVNGLKREELIAANSAALHELYFAGLGGNGELPAGTLKSAIKGSFGSTDRWHSQFVAMGKALAGGSGWVILSWSAREQRLANQWAADHTHVLADGVSLLALDMYEHAYHIDHGAKAAAYIEAFMENIDWRNAETRFSGSAITA